MSEWLEFRLLEITEPVKVTYLPNKSEELNYIGLEHIEQESLRLNGIGSSSDVTSNKFLFQKNDVLFGKLRPYFRKVSKPKFSGICSTDIWVFRAKNGFSQDFIFYFLANWDFIDTANGGEGGTRMPRADWNFLKTTSWNVPPLPEQKAIAAVLSSLDDKIDLLHRQNQTLEAMAETLFRQWFVVEAQEDWEVITIGECCEKITKGTTPTTLKRDFVPNGINFIKVNCIDEKGNFLNEKIEYIDEETNNLLSRSQLKEGDILYSIAGTIGRLIIVSKEILPANVNQALAIIRVNTNTISSIYIKYCLKNNEITDKLHSKIVHAVQPNLSLGEISNTLIPLPPQELLIKFQNIAIPIEQKISRIKIQIRTLETLRDTLLPKLMSGEVRASF